MEERIKHWLNRSLDNIEGEIWMPIPGHENSYLISSLLRVKSLKRKVRCAHYALKTVPEKILSQRIGKRGYWVVMLASPEKNILRTVHKIYADEFIPNPLNKKTVNHIDTIKENNFPDNLEWNTYKENNDHAKMNGLNPQTGETHCWAKLSNKIVMEIYQCPLPIFKTAKLFGVRADTVGHIKNGRAWSGLTGKKHEKKKVHVLTSDLAKDIYSANGTQRVIAGMFNISQTTVGEIKSGKTWSSITGKKYHKP